MSDDQRKVSKAQALQGLWADLEAERLQEEAESMTDEELVEAEKADGSHEAMERAYAKIDAMFEQAKREEKEKESAPSEAPAVKPASTQKPPPERSNVIDLSTRRRIIRWAAGSGVIAGAAIAAGVAAIYVNVEYPATPIPTTTSPTGDSTGSHPPTPKVQAQERRYKAFDECFNQDFDACLRDLEEAKRIDPDGDHNTAVDNAREYIRQHIATPNKP